MAASNEQQQGRIFVKQVGEQEKTRTVYTASDETSALFDGYVERSKPGKTAAARAATGADS